MGLIDLLRITTFSKHCVCFSFSLQALSTLDSITLMYPFFYRPMFEVIEDGWHSFLPEQEFELLSSVVSPIWNRGVGVGVCVCIRFFLSDSFVWLWLISQHFKGMCQYFTCGIMFSSADSGPQGLSPSAFQQLSKGHWQRAGISQAPSPVPKTSSAKGSSPWRMVCLNHYHLY